MNAITPTLLDTTSLSSTPKRDGVELLYTPAESIFAAAAPDMVANGWSVMPQTIDRKPGSVYGAMVQWGANGLDLANVRPGNDLIERWTMHCATNNVACVMGAASGNTFAIDIDVLDEGMSAQIVEIANEHLGYTPLRREGRFPKLALIYRHAPDDVVKSVSRWIADGDDNASEHGIEILGAGKLLTFHGRHHKTGKYFTWLDQGPQVIGPEAAPLVSSKYVEGFLNEVDRVFGFSEHSKRPVLTGGATWTPDGVFVPAGQKANDGREQAMVSVINTSVTSFDPNFWTAVDAGDAALVAFRDAKLTEICNKFAAANELSGRWAPHMLACEATGRLEHWIGKLKNGKRPPASKMRAPKAAGEAAQQAPLEGWMGELLVNDKGAPKALLANALIALEKAPDWKGVLRYDLFAGTVMLYGRPPYDRAQGAWKSREVRDVDITWTANWLQQHGISVGVEVTMAAMAAVADANPVHPVRDYLNGLTWDGKPRIDTWLTDFAGVRDVPLHRLYAAKFLIGAVARVMQPGCKLDTMLILEGRQGLRKSTTFRVLAGDWFTDHLPEIGSKDSMIQLRGVWILEHAEMSGMSKSDAKSVKAFVATQTDRYRAPFGKVSEEHPRQCIFGASMNPMSVGYLQDETGNRRFWPVLCGEGWDAHRQIDSKALAEARDQLWAEAVARYNKGETWYLETAEAEAEQAESASLRASEDVWHTKVQEFVKAKTCVTMDEILAICLQRNTDSWSQADQMRVGRIMSMLGWTKKAVRVDGGGREKRYFPPENRGE